MSTSLAVFRLLLKAVRPPCLSCDASTSAECFGASPPQLCLCFACWLLSAGSTSELSRSLISSMSLARGAHHSVLDLAPLHPTAAQLGLRGLTVHAHGHVLPGPSELPGLTLLEHLHKLLFLAAWSHWLLWDSQQHFVRLLLAMLFFTGSWVLVPGWFIYGSLGPNNLVRVSSNILLTPACFTVSSTTSKNFKNQLLPQKHSCYSIHGTSSTLTSRASRT